MSRGRVDKKKAVAYAMKRSNRQLAAIAAIKEASPCVDCGCFYPACVMDFDHISSDKVRDVSSMNTYSMSRILVEIAKCELVCANCHRIRTRDRRIVSGTMDTRRA